MFFFYYLFIVRFFLLNNLAFFGAIEDFAGVDFPSFPLFIQLSKLSLN